MPKPQPSIIINRKLKVQMIDRLIEESIQEFDIDEEFKRLYFTLILDYALIKFQLQKYISTVPYNELDKYKNLKKQKENISYKIKKLKDSGM